MDFKKIAHRLLYTDLGQIFMSSLFGILLAFMFKRVCKENCVIYIAPDTNEIEGKIFKLGESCYKYKHKQVACDGSPIEYNNTGEIADNKIIEPTFMSKIFS
jgi:hypothetical protein